MNIKKYLVRIAGSAMMLGVFYSPAIAETLPTINFELPTYVVGNINGQDGWSKTGTYDVEVVNNTYGFTSFGAQALRISNAVTSGSFGDHAFSKSLVNEAGESTAESGGMSGGTRESYFEATWDFASTVPETEQPGLSVVASPDRGDGARMSWIQMKDTTSGLEVNFYDVQGVEAGQTAPCFQCANFVFTNIVSGLNRTVPHNIKITMQFVEGESNDIVKIYVDGILQHTGGSWEDYFTMDTESSPTEPRVSRTVDSILFRVGGIAAPGTSGSGYLIDNVVLGSSTIVMPTVPVISSPANGAIVTVSNMVKIDWSDSTGTYSPFEYQYQAYADSGYTSSIYTSGWLTASEIPTLGTPPGDYYVRVMAKDTEGNLSAWSNGATDPYKITVVADVVTPTTPSNMNECKKNGWTAFVSLFFKNQGDCVSYVQSNINAVGNKTK